VKVILLCRSLSVGGTERQLVTLAKGLRQHGIEIRVAVFYGGGVLENDLRDSGVEIIDLRKSRRWDLLAFFFRTVRIIRVLKPEIVYGFLAPANALATIVGWFIPKTRVVWGVRAAYVDLHRYDWVSRATYRLERLFAHFADLIICNSQAGLKYAAAHGFPKRTLRVVVNGIDTSKFRPDDSARTRIREEFGIGRSEHLVGLVARLDPMKDHETFLRAAAMLARSDSSCRFVCVGDGPETYKLQLKRLAADLELECRLIWCGARNDMPDVFNALDIACSSSYGEGFSNVIAEAMACGIPCVVTDVGDSASIVAGNGIVVPPRVPSALCEGMRQMLRTAPGLRGAASRSIRERFSNEAMVNNTLDLLCQTV
jgi:glycosyltransferase involved in cell wall biosynthesis